ncbi:MAG: hypothetical protein OEW15_04060 [Nitrospirota bacterium]|nr:hypothetical protein [Nitrospirota bacterium]
MNCPFLDSAAGSLCMVLRAAGDLPPACAEPPLDGRGDREYRRCLHYGAVLSGGLARIVRYRGRRRTAGRSPLKSAS